jgi:hypothetical protein
MEKSNKTSHPSPAGVQRFKSNREAIKHVTQVLEKIHATELEKVQRKGK